MPDDTQNPFENQPSQPTTGDSPSTATPGVEAEPAAVSPEETSGMPVVETEPPTHSTADFSAASSPDSAAPALTDEPNFQPVASPDSSQTNVASALPTSGTAAGGGKKKKWLVGGIIAAAAVVIIGGGVAAYNLWYQNPDKVILDSIGHLINQKDDSSGKAVVSVKNKDVSVEATVDLKKSQDLVNGGAKVAFEIKSDGVSSGKMNLSADFATDKNTAYFRLKGVRTLAKSFIDSYIDSSAKTYSKHGYNIPQKQIDEQKQAFMKQLDPVINKVDNRWIKIDTSSSSSDDQSKCTTNAIQKLSTDKKERDEVLSVYKDNKFITVKNKLGSKNGSLGYALNFDSKVANKFGKAVDQTTFGKELKKCDKDSSSDSPVIGNNDTDSDDNSLADENMELWVSRWSHQITELKFSATTTDSDKTTISVDATYDHSKVDGLSTPKNAIDINDLEKELNGGSPGLSPLSLLSTAV